MNSPKAKKKNPNLQDLFTRSLRLELGGLCVAGMAACCNKIFKSETYERSRKVLTAAMHFLASDRTLDEHHAMRESIVQCRCDLKNPFIAKLHEKVGAIDLLNITILELSFAIMDALSPGPKKSAPPVDNSGKELHQVVLGMTDWLELAEAEDQLGPLPAEWLPPKEPEVEEEEDPEPEPSDEPWPSAPADVFTSPKGIGQTLQNLLCWTSEPCGGSGVFLLISRLSDYSPTFAAEVLTAEIVLPCAMVHLEQALDRFEAKAPPETFRLAIASVTHFLHQIPTRRFVRLLFDFNDLLLALARRIQPALAEMPGPEAAFAKQWWTSLHTSIQLGPTYQWENVKLYRLMRAYRARAICKKAGCAHRADPAPKTMMFCRRCALTCYCSAQCQKTDWSKGNAPHKPLCNAVDALRHATDLESDALWKDVLTRSGLKADDLFAQICEAKGVDPAMSEAIAGQLRKHDTVMWMAGSEK
ncbi:hypothetical protein DFH09DRAFT_1359851 [Mycena vulgaris]|nr:hypothetical protein DFH09DRAFT_1359851 [Mycena vulgaris]